MRNHTLTIALTLAFGAVAYAGPETIGSSSKEMKTAVAPAAECDFTWTGFYIGVNGGGAFGDNDTRFQPLPNQAAFIALRDTKLSNDLGGGFGGGQIGFNWQAGKFVFGVEADFQGGDISGDHTISPVPELVGVALPNGPGTFLHTDQDINWFGTARGRIGFAPICKLLVYGTGGFAYGNADYTAETNFAADGGPIFRTSHDDTNVGWTVGGGLEYAISKHWTVKAEYLYVDLDDENRTANPNSANFAPLQVRNTWENQFHTVRAGLNFKF
jgi:outer membrane immunogenic protein